MKNYRKKFAQLYNLFYSGKDYANEAKWINNLLGKHHIPQNAHIIELACGTGNHAFELEKYGYNILCTDLSADMISIAKKKAIKLKSMVNFIVTDMRELPVYKQKFDVALCMFDSIGYTITNKCICNTLSGIRKNLKKNGLFIFEFWHASAMIKNHEKYREKIFLDKNNKRIQRISETSIDYVKQTASVYYTLNQFVKNGWHSMYAEVHKNRFFSIPEMSFFLTQSGFTPLIFFDGYTNSKKISDKSWHILAVARKK